MDGNINFIGSLSGSIDEGGGGGGSTVTITPTYSSGTKLADYTIDETSGAIFVDLSNYPTYEYTESRYTPLATFNNYTIVAEREFQKRLTAGENITIDPVTNIISASGGGGINYSTTEQDTELTWIDGKHIYQKTIVDTLTSAVSHFSLPNVDTYIKADACLYNNGKTYSTDLPYWESTNFFASKQYDYVNETFDIVATQNVANSYTNLVATIYYTKKEI